MWVREDGGDGKGKRTIEGRVIECPSGRGGGGIRGRRQERASSVGGV
jgi:hypothetical protein